MPKLLAVLIIHGMGSTNGYRLNCRRLLPRHILNHESTGLGRRILANLALLGLAAFDASCGSAVAGNVANDSVATAVSPSGTVDVFVGKTQSVSVTFTTSDAAPASNLRITSDWNSLPAGWSMTSTRFNCASVSTRNSCALKLSFAPTAADSGTVTLAYSYNSNDGTAKAGSVGIPFTALLPTLEFLAGSTGGPGSADDTSILSRFSWFKGVAVDGTGNVYVADFVNHTIHKITPSGVVMTLAGTAGAAGSADDTSSTARFDGPTGVAVDSAGNVYVTDHGNHTIRKITPSGVVTTLAGIARVDGSADGPGNVARFGSLNGIAVDGAGNVYVTDWWNATIRKITPSRIVTTLAGTARREGSRDGTGAAARFAGPNDVAVDNAGNLYIADGNPTIRKITPGGVVTTVAGRARREGSRDGAGAAARFQGPSGVAVDGAGNVYVSDSGAHTIRKITPSGIVTTLAEIARVNVSADGPGTVARFGSLEGVAVDGAGNVYVTDWWNYTIRKITPSGIVTTLAGTAGQEGSADGTGATARFDTPKGIAVDGAGNVYVTEWGNATIRKITPGGVVTTVAGRAGRYGSRDGRGTAARFGSLRGVAVDNAGNLYIADDGNGTIRKMRPDGVVATVAGTAGQQDSADGTGSKARFDHPGDVAVDTAGNVYVTDWRNKTIRKITPSGVVTTLAGTAGVAGSADGRGSEALFDKPSGAAVDSGGNVYVADSGNHTIRKITPAGIVTTIIGKTRSIHTVPGPLPAQIGPPVGVAVLPDGQLVIIMEQAVLKTNGL